MRSGIGYDNRYTYESGNPLLVSEISRNINYTVSYKWLMAEGIYTHVSDPIVMLTQSYKDNPNIALIQNVNWKPYNRIGASLSASPKFGIWHPSLSLYFFKQWFDMETHGGHSLDNPKFTVRFDNTFDTKLAMFTLMMSYNTKGHEQNIYFRKPLFCTNMSIYKACMKNRLSFQLFVYDLFGTNDQHFIAHFGKLRSMAYDASSISKLTLTVRYAFNASRSKYKGTGAGTEQKGRM